jgi:hypothetical protein
LISTAAVAEAAGGEVVAAVAAAVGGDPDAHAFVWGFAGPNSPPFGDTR